MSKTKRSILIQTQVEAIPQMHTIQCKYNLIIIFNFIYSLGRKGINENGIEFRLKNNNILSTLRDTNILSVLKIAINNQKFWVG